MNKPEIADRAADATLTGPEHLGSGGFYGYDRFGIALDGETFQRDVVRIGRAVAMLAVDLDRDEVVLIRQFRVGAHLALGQGDLVEVPAGLVERGESLADAARRECLEELGVPAQKLVPIFNLMPSAGSSDEHMFFFLAVVDAAKVPERTGAVDESEHIRPLRATIDEALAALKTGKLHYSATVFSLQWLALNRDRLREIAAG
jgi:ADP-ribose pyrophosphatase